MKKLISLALMTLLAAALLSGCSDDCIYKFYTTKAGDELCGHFCPKEDEEGNKVLDDDGEVVYDKPDSVARVNCELPVTTTTGTATTSSSSTTSN